MKWWYLPEGSIVQHGGQRQYGCSSKVPPVTVGDCRRHSISTAGPTHLHHSIVSMEMIFISGQAHLPLEWALGDLKAGHRRMLIQFSIPFLFYNGKGQIRVREPACSKETPSCSKRTPSFSTLLAPCRDRCRCSAPSCPSHPVTTVHQHTTPCHITLSLNKVPCPLTFLVKITLVTY